MDDYLALVHERNALRDALEWTASALQEADIIEGDRLYRADIDKGMTYGQILNMANDA